MNYIIDENIRHLTEHIHDPQAFTIELSIHHDEQSEPSVVPFSLSKIDMEIPQEFIDESRISLSETSRTSAKTHARLNRIYQSGDPVNFDDLIQQETVESGMIKDKKTLMHYTCKLDTSKAIAIPKDAHKITVRLMLNSAAGCGGYELITIKFLLRQMVQRKVNKQPSEYWRRFFEPSDIPPESNDTEFRTWMITTQYMQCQVKETNQIFTMYTRSPVPTVGTPDAIKHVQQFIFGFVFTTTPSGLCDNIISHFG